MVEAEETAGLMDKANDNDGVDDYQTIEIQSEEEEDSIYPYSSIKIERDQYSIFEMKRKYDRGRLSLDPDFQRNFVWSVKQQSELIESVVMGIPLPLVYLAENKEGHLVVVDGRQRLTTFIRFLNNELRLGSLKILGKLNGKKYSDLEMVFPNYASAIEDYQLVIQVIKYPTPDRIRFDIFDRVNRGGTQLNKQEMRNALYQGGATVLLRELIQSDEFQSATGYGISGLHMKDQYIVLRAIAFCLVYQSRLIDRKGKIIEYKSDIDDLMAKTMEYLNRIDEAERKEIQNEFREIMGTIHSILGENAFRIPKSDGRRRPISMTLFETMYYMFFCIRGIDVSKDVVKRYYESLMMDEDYLDSLQYSVDSSKSVEARFGKVLNCAEGMIGECQLIKS